MERDLFSFNSQSPHRFHSGEGRGGAAADGGGGGPYGDGPSDEQRDALKCWRKVKCLGDIPGPRSGAASVIVGSKMYMFGECSC